MSNVESFKQHVSKNANMREVAERVAADYIQHARDLGVNIQQEDLYQLSAYRLHVLTGTAVDSDWTHEARIRMPQFQRLAEEEAALEAIMDAQNSRHEEELAKFAALKPDARMNASRGTASGIRKGSQTKRALTPAQRAEAVRTLEKSGVRGTGRIALARKLGLE